MSHYWHHVALTWYKSAAVLAKAENKIPIITLTEANSTEVFVVCQVLARGADRGGLDD